MGPRQVLREAGLDRIVTIRVLADLIRTKAARNGNKCAIRAENDHVSYAQIDERSNRLAHMLASHGVGMGARAAYLSRNRIEFFDILFGAAKIGAATVPVNWRLAEAEVAGVLTDARPSLLFLEPELARLIDRSALEAQGVVVIDLPETNAEWVAMLASFPDDDPQIEVPVHEVMYQLYTSGTTGKPKGVMLTHENLFCMAEPLADAWHFEEGCVVYNPYPVFHGAGILWVLMPLLRNGEAIFRRGFDEVDLLESIERHRVNITLMVPAVLNMVLNHERAKDADLSSLQHVIYGVAPISQAVLEQAIARLPTCQFHHAYGSTESAGTITTMQWVDHRPGTERMRSCGRPFEWLEMRIVDPESRMPVGTRAVGEVAVRGRIVMKGYFDNPDETARVVDSDGWLYTGDAGFVDEDGFLYLTDRIKDMIISGGENIYPAEVENVIFAMPQVKEVAVIGIPDEVWGERVLAVVVPHDGKSVSAEEVIAFSRERLAHYKCPRQVDIRREPLPLNPTGKVLRRVLRDPYWADQRFKV